jgi:hypothetical protein
MGLLLPGLTPSPETKEIDALLGRLYNIHQYIFAVYVPLVVGIMMMSCFWAYTQCLCCYISFILRLLKIFICSDDVPLSKQVGRLAGLSSGYVVHGSFV